MCIEAAKKVKTYSAAFREIMSECFRLNASREQSSPRDTFEQVVSLRSQLIEYARPTDLCELVGACVAFCVSLTASEGSPALISDANPLARLLSVITKIWMSVKELIAAGTLDMKDGKIQSASD